MSKKEYISALRAAQDELDKLLAERAVMDKRVSNLKSSIEVLGALFDDTDHSVRLAHPGICAPIEPGISSNIRVALAQSQVPLSAVEVRNALLKFGLKLSVYANEMTVVHNTLKRLEKQEEIVTVGDQSGRNLWTLTEKGRESIRKTEQIIKRHEELIKK